MDTDAYSYTDTDTDEELSMIYDWRKELLPHSRKQIVHHIMEVLRPNNHDEANFSNQRLRRMANRFEKHMFSAASNPPDYVKRISSSKSKMLAILKQPNTAAVAGSSSSKTTPHPDPEMDKKKTEPIFHPFHPHELLYSPYSAGSVYVLDCGSCKIKKEGVDCYSCEHQYRCRACMKRLDGPHYRCASSECRFGLHKGCTKQPLEILHPFHPRHKLELFESKHTRTYLVRQCFACLLPVYGFCYKCHECDDYDDDDGFLLHLSCALLTKNRQPSDRPQKVSFKHAVDEDPDLILHDQVWQIYNFREFRNCEDKWIHCAWCAEPLLSGKSYVGHNWKLYLHEDCTFEMPRQLHLPSKPSSSSTYGLQLACYQSKCCLACKGKTKSQLVCDNLDNYGYGNDIFHAKCIYRLLSSLKSQHHEHDLAYFENASFKGKFSCYRCGKDGRDGFNGFYRCIKCDQNFHLSCILEPTLTHKYHPHPLIIMNSFKEFDEDEYFCDICETERNENHCIYSCKEECGYCVVHIECALDQERSHLLYLAPKRPSEFLLSLEIKYDSNTGKKSTEDELGELQLPRQLFKFLLHSCHTLTLKLRSKRDFICDVCGEFNKKSSTNYKCQECSFIIDVKCGSSSIATLSQRRQRGFKKTRFRHFCHHHPLHLRYFKNTDHLYCEMCPYKIGGLGYFCFECKFSLHESCLKHFPREISLPFHPLHPLVFMKGMISQSHCLVCGSSKDNNLYYGCGSCEDTFVHSICASFLKKPLICDSHEHMLYYFGTHLNRKIRSCLKEYHWFECEKCGECCLESFYRCMECKINFHLDCVPIPRVFKTKFHRHHVRLIDSISIKGYDDEDQYCDVCEEQRDPKEHAYHCGECSDLFVGHIECIIFKVKDRIEVGQVSPKSCSNDLMYSSVEITAEQSLGIKFEIENENGFIFRLLFGDIHPIKPWFLFYSLPKSHVEIWDYQTQKSIWKMSLLTAPHFMVVGKFISPKSWILIGDSNGLIYVYDRKSSKLIRKFKAYEEVDSDDVRFGIEAEYGFVVHPHYNYLLSWSPDGYIKLWEMEKWRCIKKFHLGHPNQHRSLYMSLKVAFNSKDHNIFATVSVDDSLVIWNLDSFTPTYAVRVHSKKKGITSVGFFMIGDKEYVVGGLGDGRIKMWDYRTRNCVFELDCHLDGVTAIRSLPTGLPTIVISSPSSLVACTFNAKNLRCEYMTVKDFPTGEYSYLKSIEFYKGSQRLMLGGGIKVFVLKVTFLEGHIIRAPAANFLQLNDQDHDYGVQEAEDQSDTEEDDDGVQEADKSNNAEKDEIRDKENLDSL